MPFLRSPNVPLRFEPAYRLGFYYIYTFGKITAGKTGLNGVYTLAGL